MILHRIFALVVTAIAVPFVLVVVSLLPVMIFVPFLLPFSVVYGTLALVICAFFPLFGLCGFWWVRRWLLTEQRHISVIGREKALWAVSSWSEGSLLVDYVTMQRESVSTLTTPLAFEEEFWTELSVSYCTFIDRMSMIFGARASPQVALGLSLFGWWQYCVRVGRPILSSLFWVLVAAACLVVCSPPDVVNYYLWVLLQGAFYLTPVGWTHLRVRIEWCRLWIVALMLDVALLLASLNSEMSRHYSDRLAGKRRKFKAILRGQIMRTVHFISSVRLPEFVRNRFVGSVPPEALARGREIMAELGWPVTVDIVDAPVKEDAFAKHPEWSTWKVADTDFATGIRQLKLDIAESLQELRGIAPAYYRTEEYKTIDNELVSTSRYFNDRNVTFSVDILDDVWDVVRPIFANSRLTKFGDIIYLWEKKYALGFWMTDEKRVRKLSRRSFIARVGMPAFRQLWAKTFVRASEIMPVAHVSVKDELLSPAKFLADKVRSIIGSPLTHYIASTVFSHQPNHRFDYENGPIKIGMPLNGYWLGRVFERHARFSVHIEGDFTAFDSTIEGPIKDVVRAIRKRGYDAHKDKKAICDLIDVMYDQLDHQYLGFTSTGAVARKGSGLTTGHSSTSMDNSVSLVTFYLAAWKSLTGLSAREFLHFNELSCYGDDHLLSIQATAPRAWTAANIRKVMASWGVVNNVTEKKLKDIQFLSKHNSGLTPAFQAELNEHGLTHVTRVIYHDKAKLVGKLTSKLKSTQPTYRATRLYSYIQLTAHHPEIYQAIAKELEKEPLKSIVKNNFSGYPSYHQVMVNWYKRGEGPSTLPDGDANEDWVNDGSLVLMGQPSLLDHVLQVLAVVPDLLNPTLFNFGPTRAIVSLLAPHLQWVVSFVQRANGIAGFANLDYHLARTPYSWLSAELVSLQGHPDNFTTLLVRHWLFILYHRLRPSFRPLAVVDWVMRKSADLAFMTKGQVMTDLPRDTFPFDLVMVAALLEMVYIPFDVFSWMENLDFPDVGAMLDVAWNACLVFLWTSIPANFGEVDEVLKRTRKGDKPILIEAPTGTGKSTALVAHLSMSQVKPHRKLVVVEPRSLLAIGLASYVGDTFGLYTSAATSGSTFDPKAAVWFMTPQSFLGHLQILNKRDLIVIDEAHLPEPLVTLLVDLVHQWGFTVIWTTATPSQALKDECKTHVSVPISQVFKSTVVDQDLPSVSAYRQEAINLANTYPRHVKVMVLLDTPDDVDWALKKSNYTGQGLSSRHDPRINDVTRYFATNVVDVGVTVPGLDVFIIPDWVYGGAQVRYELDEATLGQRRGRVGRTNNGTLLRLRVPGTVFGARPRTEKTHAWAEAFSAGISPALGWEIDPDSMKSFFGLENVSEAQERDFKRVSHIFLTNFRKMKELELAARDMPAGAGPPAVMVPTGSLGHFSGSVPQDLPAAHAQSITLLKALLSAIQKGDQVYGLLKEKLATVRTGPLYRVANVLTGLANDPSGWRPELLGSAQDADSVDFDEEIQKIHDLLESFKET